MSDPSTMPDTAEPRLLGPDSVLSKDSLQRAIGALQSMGHPGPYLLLLTQRQVDRCGGVEAIKRRFPEFPDLLVEVDGRPLP